VVVSFVAERDVVVTDAMVRELPLGVTAISFAVRVVAFAPGTILVFHLRKWFAGIVFVRVVLAVPVVIDTVPVAVVADLASVNVAVLVVPTLVSAGAPALSTCGRLIIPLALIILRSEPYDPTPYPFPPVLGEKPLL
jgi:hypothetical protein